MPDHREPTIRSRELGEGLRAAMERAGLNAKEMGRRLGISGPTVSRLLTGRRRAPEAEVGAFLAICDVVGEERAHLLSLCREGSKKGWFQQFGSRLPKQVRTLIEHEDKATRITHFQAHVVPGVLQTDDYARAVRWLGDCAVRRDRRPGRGASRPADLVQPV